MKRLVTLIILIIGMVCLLGVSVVATNDTIEDVSPYFSAEDAPWVEKGEAVGPVNKGDYEYYISKKEENVISAIIAEKDETNYRTYETVLNILDSCNRNSEDDEITTEISDYIKKAFEIMEKPYNYYSYTFYTGFEININGVRTDEAEQLIPDTWPYIYIKVDLEKMRSDGPKSWGGAGGIITSDGSEETDKGNSIIVENTINKENIINKDNTVNKDNTIQSDSTDKFNEMINKIYDETISNTNMPKTGNGYEIDIVSYVLLTIIGLAFISSFIIIRKSKTK